MIFNWYKIFICDQAYYGQVDILAKEGDDALIVDVIKSFTITESIAKQWQNGGNMDSNPNAREVLNKYWNRISMHKEMLNSENYNKGIVACYLLIEYSGKESSEMFVVHKNELSVPTSAVSSGHAAANGQ